MSLENYSSQTSPSNHILASDEFQNCPEKLKKTILEMVSLNRENNPSETLDNLLKVFGDTIDEPYFASIVLDMIQSTCIDSALHQSEAEFAILSLQNVFQSDKFTSTIKCKILVVMTTALLSSHESASDELMRDIINFLLDILNQNNESSSVNQISLDCLIEIELSIPGFLREDIQQFSNFFNKGKLCDKACELLAAILKNIPGDINLTDQHQQMLLLLIEKLPFLGPLSTASVTRDILGLCSISSKNIKEVLDELLNRYNSAFDMCIIQTITSIQEQINEFTDDNPIFVSSVHPALPVACNLIALDWLAENALSENIDVTLQIFEPLPFDGADMRLKKLVSLSKFSHRQGIEPEVLCDHLEQLMAFALKAMTSRALAAVFRSFRHLLEIQFSRNVVQLVVDCIVNFGSRYPACLPHVIDFLKFANENNLERSSEAITLEVVDAFDQKAVASLEPSIEYLIAFFIEISVLRYECCQPRVIILIVSKCLEQTENRIFHNTSLGALLLELCQALIRNQDYEIFQPELSAVLSSLEKFHVDRDIQQRAWMLHSLISYINTDNVKNAFDVNSDLTTVGQLEVTDTSLVVLDVLFDYQLDENRQLNWSLDRKHSNHSIYFPVEVSCAPDAKIGCTEFVGVRIEFALDPRLGKIESIYIPILNRNEIKKACLHLQPAICSPITIGARALLSTIDGRIFMSSLKPIEVKLENLLRPLPLTKTLTQLWDMISTRSEKYCTSVFSLRLPEKVFSAIGNGPLSKFQLTQTRPKMELALVTHNTLLILIRILSINNNWLAEIAVEDTSLLLAVHTLLTNYST